MLLRFDVINANVFIAGVSINPILNMLLRWFTQYLLKYKGFYGMQREPLISFQLFSYSIIFNYLHMRGTHLEH